MERHKTLKHPVTDQENSTDPFKNLLEDSAREAYARPWHRIERGLRLNRIRMFIEMMTEKWSMTKEEKEGLFLFLQKALDKKLLNTLKVVQYDQQIQQILLIKGLEIKRNSEGILKWGFSTKKEATRKRKPLQEEPTKIEEKETPV